MADWYVEPTANDTGGILEFFTFINNTATDGLFFPVILLVIWAISFISMLFSGNLDRPSGAKAFIFASFVSSILSVPLIVLGMVDSKWGYISFILLAIGVVWIILETRE